MRFEFEAVGRMSGPLAKRVIEFARVREQLPMEALADLIEAGFARIEDDALPEAYTSEVRKTLMAEAGRRGLPLDELIHKIVTTTASDKLFAAVLDAD